VSTRIAPAHLDELRKGFAGLVIVPGDAAYDGARTVFNAMIDRRPGVIAQCANVDDVVRALRFGRDRGLEIAVRGGGHSVAGRALADGGIVIDLRRMHAVSVDPEAGTATVGGGATMGHLDRATQLQCMFDDPPGYRNYWSAEYLDALPDEAIDRFSARALEMLVPSPSQDVLFPQGGAVGRAPASYPLPWRYAPWVAHPFGLWQDPADDDRARRWVRDVRADLEPWSSGAVYLNFIGDEGEDRLVSGFGREHVARLGMVKAEYDPQNVFHLNHNVRPAAGMPGAETRTPGS
jgi:FAD/FMN-containing dehydrogenase